jgi:hypothetical protein
MSAQTGDEIATDRQQFFEVEPEPETQVPDAYQLGDEAALEEPGALANATEPSEPDDYYEDEDTLDAIVPKADPRIWLIGPEEAQRRYVQKPMSFIGKMQWFSLIGDALDRAMAGPGGISLNSLFDAPGRGGQMQLSDFRNADTFVHAVGKLLAAAPDFLTKSYCIWLNVPDYDRPLVAEIMALPEDEGGLSDDDGLEMIEIFLDQNYDALASFFGERVGRLQARVEHLNKMRQEKMDLKKARREARRPKR